MKTVKLEVDIETARGVLSDFERKISERIRSRDELAVQILKLQEQAKSLRSQLQGVNGSPLRAGQGDNRSRIKEYLTKIPDNKGARMVEIRKATGIGPSSVSFTLNHYTDDFVADGKLWKLRT